MRRLVAGMIGVALFAPIAAQAAPDKTTTMTPGTTYTWDGSTASGFNYYYWDSFGTGDIGPVTHTTCDKTPAFYCDQILIEFSNPLTPEEIEAGRVFRRATATVTINNFTPTEGPITDFDLLAYESDPAGTRGARLAFDGRPDHTTQELVGFQLETDVDDPSKWVLIDVVYYQVVNGNYKGTVTFPLSL